MTTQTNRKKQKIIVTGANGFLGRAFVSLLPRNKYSVVGLSRKDVDLVNLQDCVRVIRDADTVVHMAGLVLSRAEQQKRAAEVLFQNSVSLANVYEAAARNKIPKIITVGSITSYAPNAPLPLQENDLWYGMPVAANTEYGLAKRLSTVFGNAYATQFGIQSCSVILPNIYGCGDKIQAEPPPLVPNIISMLTQAKRNQLPEFFAGDNGDSKIDLLFVDDAAGFLIKCLNQSNLPPVLNMGTGKPIAIKAIVKTVANIIGFKGAIVWDRPKQKTSVRLLDVKQMKKLFGSIKVTDLQHGLKKTIQWYNTEINI